MIHVTRLLESLQKLTGLHRQLMETIRLEREALVAADIMRIEEATVAKQALVEAIRAAEADRLKNVAEIALVTKRPLRDLTLPNLIVLIQGEDVKASEQLRTAYNALSLLIKRISEQNKENQKLVEASLVHIQEMKSNVLKESTPKNSTYTAKGQKASGVNGARLIQKDA